MNTDTTNQSQTIDPRFEEILNDISKQRLSSAASGAALLEKARILAKQLEKNDIERRVEILDKQVSLELNEAASQSLRSLYED
jgi:hypothetical protein